MSLFIRGDFTLAHSLSDFKIECDSLTSEDWDTLAYLLSKRIPRFGRVIGVPSGGFKLAIALRPYMTPRSRMTVFADDVWTTGESMRAVQQIHAIPQAWAVGAVIFARNRPDAHVFALFQMRSERQR